MRYALKKTYDEMKQAIDEMQVHTMYNGLLANRWRFLGHFP